MIVPWECEDCEHKLVDSPFVTYMECPNCESENFFHGDMIETEDFEDYNDYDDGEEQI